MICWNTSNYYFRQRLWFIFFYNITCILFYFQPFISRISYFLNFHFLLPFYLFIVLICNIRFYLVYFIFITTLFYVLSILNLLMNLVSWCTNINNLFCSHIFEGIDYFIPFSIDLLLLCCSCKKFCECSCFYTTFSSFLHIFSPKSFLSIGNFSNNRWN